MSMEVYVPGTSLAPSFSSVAIAIDLAEKAVVDAAHAHGLLITRTSSSSKSESRYISVEPRRGLFNGTKSQRRAFCAATGASFPRQRAFNIRVSDHHDFGDGTTVHLVIRVDLDLAGDLARLDVALTMLAALS